MSLGSIANLLTCQARTDGVTEPVAPCGTDGSGVAYRPVVVQAYTIDPSRASEFEAMAEPFDYVQAGVLWSFAFTSVLLCWFVARGAGTLLGLIRRG